MTPPRSVTAQIEQADRSLRSARLLLDDGDANGALNRLYYAVFHGACTALASQGIDIPRTHTGTIGKFGEVFVKTGIVELEFGKNFKQIEQLRYAADYRDDTLSADTLDSLMAAGAAFLARMKVLTASACE